MDGAFPLSCGLLDTRKYGQTSAALVTFQVGVGDAKVLADECSRSSRWRISRTSPGSQIDLRREGDLRESTALGR